MEHNSGPAGERYAARMLKKLGYKVIARNFRSRFGEIDIIAENRQYIIFVEVKTRKRDSMVSPLEAVTYSKQRKIILTAEAFLRSCPTNLQPRFDVAAVETEQGKIVGWELYENAFFVSF